MVVPPGWTSGKRVGQRAGMPWARACCLARRGPRVPQDTLRDSAAPRNQYMLFTKHSLSKNGDSMIPRTLFNADHEAFRDSFRRFMDKEIAPFHAEWEDQGYVDREVWRKAGANGFLCMTMPEAWGGLHLIHHADLAAWGDIGDQLADRVRTDVDRGDALPERRGVTRDVRREARRVAHRALSSPKSLYRPSRRRIVEAIQSVSTR